MKTIEETKPRSTTKLKAITFFILMILLLPGLAQAAPPPSVPAWNHFIDQPILFQVQYTTDKVSYIRGITIEFTLTNNRLGPITYSFPAAVINKTSGEIVYEINSTVPPQILNFGESDSWTWNQRTSSDVLVPPGIYYGQVGFYRTRDFIIYNLWDIPPPGEIIVNPP